MEPASLLQMATGNVAQSSEQWLSDMASSPLVQASVMSRHESLLSMLYRNPSEALATRGGGGHFLTGYPNPYSLSPHLMYSYAAGAFGSSMPTHAHHVVLPPASGGGMQKADGDSYSPPKGSAHFPPLISQVPPVVPPTQHHSQQFQSYMGPSERTARSPQLATEAHGNSRATTPKAQSQAKRHSSSTDEAWTVGKDSTAKRQRQSATAEHCPSSASPSAMAPPRPPSGSQTVHTPAVAASAGLPHRAVYFRKGSIVQLADDRLKRVEDLTTDDFVQCASASLNLKLDSSTVAKIVEDHAKGTALLTFHVGESRVQVEVEALLEHPFFVFHRGWASACPERTMKVYHLACHQLTVGDCFISLTHKEPPLLARAQASSAPVSAAQSLTQSRRQSLATGGQSRLESFQESKSSSASRSVREPGPE